MNTKQNCFSLVLLLPKICERFCANILFLFFSFLFCFCYFSLFFSLSFFILFFFFFSFLLSLSFLFCFRLFSFLLLLFLSFVRTFYEQSIYIQQKTQIKREKNLVCCGRVPKQLHQTSKSILMKT